MCMEEERMRQRTFKFVLSNVNERCRGDSIGSEVIDHGAEE